MISSIGWTTRPLDLFDEAMTIWMELRSEVILSGMKKIL